MEPERPKYMWEGHLVDVPDDVYEAWLDAGSPTAPPPQVDSLPEPLA